MSEEEVFDTASVNSVKLQFFDGEKWVQDNERSQTVVKLIESGACKQKKLPADYIIDMNETLSQCCGTSELTEDGGVIKYLMNETNGNIVTQESIIKAKFECRLPDGKLKDLEAIRSNCHKISFLSSKPLKAGMRKALLSMRQGEVSWFKFIGKYNYQEDLYEEKYADITSFYKIELVDIQCPKKHVNNSNLEERLMMMDSFREKGLQSFKSGNIDQARKTYQKALNYVNNSWPKSIPIDQKTAEKIKISRIIFNNNLAQCEIKARRYTEAKALLEPMVHLSRGSFLEVKTYFRLALSLCELDEHERAQTLLKELRTLVDLSQEENADILLLERKIGLKLSGGLKNGRRKRQ